MERSLNRLEAARNDPDIRDVLPVMRAAWVSHLDADVRPLLSAASTYLAAHPDQWWAADFLWSARMTIADAAGAAQVYAHADPANPDLADYLGAIASSRLELDPRETAQQTIEQMRAHVLQTMQLDPAPIARLFGLTTLAQIEALSGNRAAALERVAEADRLLSIEEDPIDGAATWSQLLFIPNLVGERAQTLSLLNRFLAVRTSTTPQALWCSPWIAKLRSDPEFRAIMAQRGVDVSRDPAGRPIPAP